MAKLKLPTPEDLSKQPIDLLPENELNAKATSTDGKTADVQVSVQKTTEKGLGIGVFGKAKLGAGKPKDMTVGVEVKKKFGKPKPVVLDAEEGDTD